MAEIKAADVAKLRNITGAGMMDCKKALTESNGDFELAVDILRKKGQKVASNRADRDATEGVVLGKTTDDGKFAAIVVVNCETDFVAKNEDFIKFGEEILAIALDKKPASLEELKGLSLGKSTIADEIINKTGVIGEKIDLSYYQSVSGETTIAYIHPGNRLSSIVAFNVSEFDIQVAKDVAMQIAAMSPVAIDKTDVPQSVIDKEIEIGKEQAINDGKPAEMAEKIAVGKLNKFFQESTLLNQFFIKDNKSTVRDYLTKANKNLTVTGFKRFGLSN